MTKIKYFEGFWSVKDVLDNQNCLFVFGDNDKGFGKKGQAIIRYCKNTIGIPTKKYPSLYESSFYNDDEFEINIQKLDIAFKKLCENAKNYDFIVFPKDGLGTGLSKLDTKAPKTFKYLNDKLKNLDSIL